MRVNIVFEHALSAILVAAAVGGGLKFIIHFPVKIIAGHSLFGALLSAMFSSLTLAAIIFLLGFLSSVVIVAPLFRVLEKAKRRTVWPYIATFIGLGAIGLGAAASLPRIALDVSVVLSVLAACLSGGVIFSRSLKPVWRAAQRAETASGAAADVKKPRLLH